MFSLLLQDEQQRKVGKSLNTESSTLAVKNSGSFAKVSNKSKFGRPRCTYCGALGHVVNKCYKLHGYPPSYKFKNKGQQVETLLLPVMLSPLTAIVKRVLVLLEQNINSSLACSILIITLVLKHHKNVHIKLPLSSHTLLWIFKGMRCQVSVLLLNFQLNFLNCLTTH